MSGAWRGYYLTAYGIAVKHGFVGSEEEWLETLVGAPGAKTELRLNEDDEQVEWRLESEEEWQKLFSVAELRGEVVNQTLETAAYAAQLASQTLAEAEDAKEQVLDAKSETRLAAEAAKAAKTDAESAAEAAQTARAAAGVSQVAAAESAAKARESAEAVKSAEDAAREAAERAKASEELVTENARKAQEAKDAAEDAATEAKAAAKDAQEAKGTVLEAVETAAEAKNAAQTAAEAAQTARAAAGVSQVAAAESAVKAAENARDLNAAALEAKSWAVGGTGTRAGEDTDNARYYKEQARQIAGGDFATPAEVAGAVSNHNADEEAHPAIWEAFNRFRRKVLRIRSRDAAKDDFGLEVKETVLELGPYTGTAEVAVQLSGELYDAANISHNGDAIPDGNFIVSKEEC